MSASDLPIQKPVPRRPFESHPTNVPTSEMFLPPSPGALTKRLEAQANGNSGTDASDIGRTQSVMNLTSSTLLGIYSPTGYSNEREEPLTPWGTGAETPRDRSGMDGAKQSSSDVRSDRPLVQGRSSQHVAQMSLPSYLLNLLFRTTLLFCIGMGYGLLVTHLHDDRKLAPFQVEGIMKPSYNWPYLVFWGVAGVALGSLLPWVDTLWEDTTKASQNSTKERSGKPEEQVAATAASGISQDWNPVVRSIGAFVGIAFAIRKLPWTSTLQVSLTLALVNPVLWYLIDRSKPGFLLSAGVGVVGTGVLLSLNPEMMPSPAAAPGFSSHVTNSSVTDTNETSRGLVSQETMECGTWIISVLFCSCVCFGNIGRRLALKRGKIAGQRGGF